jgi:peroxiredoxin
MGPPGIENNMKALSDAGIRVVTISVDKPEKTRVNMVQEAGYTFTFLSDPKLDRGVLEHVLVDGRRLRLGPQLFGRNF